MGWRLLTEILPDFFTDITWLTAENNKRTTNILKLQLIIFKTELYLQSLAGPLGLISSCKKKIRLIYFPYRNLRLVFQIHPGAKLPWAFLKMEIICWAGWYLMTCRADGRSGTVCLEIWRKSSLRCGTASSSSTTVVQLALTENWRLRKSEKWINLC